MAPPAARVVPLIGWAYAYYASGTQPSDLPVLLTPIPLSLLWLAAGAVAFLVWARVGRIWPFGPKEIREAFGTDDEPRAVNSTGVEFRQHRLRR